MGGTLELINKTSQFISAEIITVKIVPWPQIIKPGESTTFGLFDDKENTLKVIYKGKVFTHNFYYKKGQTPEDFYAQFDGKEIKEIEKPAESKSQPNHLVVSLHDPKVRAAISYIQGIKLPQ